jgi:hypothetical protein
MQITQITQFHENPALIAWWCARLDRILRWLTPFRRRAILATGAIWACIKISLLNQNSTDSQLPTTGIGVTLVILVLLGMAWLIYRAAAGFSSLPLFVRKHPQLTLHSVYWGFLVLLWTTAPTSGLWRQVLFGVALAFPFLIWRFGYLLLSGQHGRMTGTRFSDHWLTLWPIYGGTETPYGKGFGYLSRCEAKTEEELARSQLAGIKLLILCGLWRIVLNVMEGVLYGPGNALTEKLGGYTLGIPKLSLLVAGAGIDTAPWLSWGSVYCELFYQVLRHAIRGHAIIAVLRLFGFNVFRNTYKPLLAESIVEFWNRYYYYFKELLANFFFLPTFTQLGKKLRNWPDLRLFAAVFAAAFIGNTYYHLIKLEQLMPQGQVLDALYGLRSRMFYCALLALGIFISMLRQQRRKGQAPASGVANRVLRIAGVWTFFSLIFIWNVKGDAPFTTRVNFFLSLFGFA